MIFKEERELVEVQLVEKRLSTIRFIVAELVYQVYTTVGLKLGDTNSK